MQEAAGLGIFGSVKEIIGFNATIGFVKPRGGGGGDLSNYLDTESDYDIQAESGDDIILEQ